VPKLANYGTTTARMLVAFLRKTEKLKKNDCVKRYPSHFKGSWPFRPRGAYH